jgi:hypothetical protein
VTVLVVQKLVFCVMMAYARIVKFADGVRMF